MIFGASVHRKSMSLSGSKKTALEVARDRLTFVGIVFSFAYFIIAIRAFDLAVLQGELERLRGNEIVVALEKKSEQVLRADIVDRNGVLLATTLRTASLYADPAMIMEPEATARGLSRIFPDISYSEAHEKLTSNRRFVWIARNLTPDGQAKVLELGEPGLNFKVEPRRIYPQGSLVSHVIGFTDIDGKGLAGIERGLDEQLSVGGEPVALSIDVRLQHFLRREMSAAINNFDAKAGAGLVMDIRSGEVLAAVSLPDFDPHDPGSADSRELFNRVTLGVFESGSIFKIFSMAAFLEYEKADMGERFDVREPLERGRYTIKDFHSEDRILKLPEVFIYSSNIGSALIGERVGTRKLQEFYSDLGLFDAPQTDVPETGKPLVPDPWRDINTLTASYGHGIAVSPLQLISAVATVTGDGTLVRPTFRHAVQKMADGHQNATIFQKLRIVRPQTVHRIRQLLRLAVTDGTGSKANVSGYRVGGKTGTADKSGPGGYDSDRLLSSFVGVFPMEDPQYAVLVMIDEPKGNKNSFGFATGGWVAAPAVGSVISSTGALLGVPVKFSDEDKLAGPLKRYVRQEKKEKLLASY